MKHHLWLLTAACIGSLLVSARPHSAAAAALNVGDPAPPITVKAFVKGTPVNSLPAGKVSVVEFWATWCGPCKMSIPHITEMAKKFPDVTFVGVSVFESDQSGVVPFVKSMGEKMDYHVCMDSVPDGAKGQDGKMARAWMEAAEQPGIPTAFIVGKDGRIDWIGHPMEMEEPLTRITSGNWDLTAAKMEMAKKQAEQAEQESKQKALAAEMAEVNAKFRQAAQAHDVKGEIAAIDEGIGKHPDLEKTTLGPVKFLILRQNDPAAAAVYGAHFVSSVINTDTLSLNEFAWQIVDPKAKLKATPALDALALQAAKQADTLSSGKDGAIADTLAAAYFATGDTADAISTEQRAIALTGTSNDQELAGMKTALATYQTAAATVNK